MDYLKQNSSKQQNQDQEEQKQNQDSVQEQEQSQQSKNTPNLQKQGSVNRNKKSSGHITQPESLLNSIDFNKFIRSPQLTVEKNHLVELYNEIIAQREQEQPYDKPVYVLGISGGSSAGKSLLSTLIKYNIQQMQGKNKVNPCIIQFSQTDFYHTVPKEPQGVNKEEFRSNYLATKNFDVPEAIDWQYFNKCVRFVKSGNPVDVPVYNMEKETREKKFKKIRQKADIIIVEGTLVFNNQELRDLFDLKIFLDTDEDTRLSRRVYKDCCIRQKPLQEVITKYRKFTKESFEKYTFPTKKYADIVIPNFGGDYQISNLQKIDQDFAGFSQIDSGVVEVILSLLNNHIIKSNEHYKKSNKQEQNSPLGSPQLIAEKEPKIYQQNIIN